MPTGNETLQRELVISRVLDAPRELVWKAFTDPAHMRQWWGPKGFKVIASIMDLRPGGTYHYGLQGADGNAMWGKLNYREIVAPERLVAVMHFSDEAGGVTRHPLSASWPLHMLSTFAFEEHAGDTTNFIVRWSPHEASGEELQTFEAALASMQNGWGGTLDQLEAYLERAK